MNETNLLEVEAANLSLPPDKFAGLKIEREDQYQSACELLGTIGAALDRVMELFKAEVDEKYQAHKDACARRAVYADPLVEAKKNLSDVIGQYLTELEQARIAEEARANEEAARLARESQEDEVAELMDQGKTEEAFTKLNEPVFTPPIILDRKPQRIPGITIRTTWEAEVFDKMALVKAVAAGKVPLDALLPNMTFLNDKIRDQRSALGYPGVRPKPATRPARNGRR